MSYRDELAAAQARADAAMQSLEKERGERAIEGAHVAELEGALAKALEELASLRERYPEEVPSTAAQDATSKSLSSTLFLVAICLFSLIVGGVVYYAVVADHENSSEIGMAEPATKPTMKSFDVSKGIAQAHTLAREYFEPSAFSAPMLVGISATAVDDHGQAHGGVTYSFKAEFSRILSDASPQGGKPQEDTRFCHVEVVVTNVGMKIYSPKVGTPPHLCQGEVRSGRAFKITPQCTVAQVRLLSRQAGAPADALALVSLGYDESQYQPPWVVEILDDGKTIFKKAIPDRCN